MTVTLVLGGARSGKSAVAERLVGAGAVTYVATGLVADMPERVAAHRARRPPSWPTVETGADLVEAVASASGVGTLVVDSLGSWVADQPGMVVDHQALCDALARRLGDTVVVSEEVGLGVHPTSAAGRRFRDALGELNQAVASVADQVVLAVAGRALPLAPVESLVGTVLGPAAHR